MVWSEFTEGCIYCGHAYGRSRKSGELRALEDGFYIAAALNTALGCHNIFEAECRKRIPMPNAESTLRPGIDELLDTTYNHEYMLSACTERVPI